VRKGFPEFHRVQLQDFVDALREGRSPAVTGSEGRDALALAKAIYLSNLRRMPVRWPLTADDIAELEAATPS
jgi:predicted dehydrogenase